MDFERPTKKPREIRAWDGRELCRFAAKSESAIEHFVYLSVVQNDITTWLHNGTRADMTFPVRAGLDCCMSASGFDYSDDELRANATYLNDPSASRIMCENEEKKEVSVKPTDVLDLDACFVEFLLVQRVTDCLASIHNHVCRIECIPSS